MCYLHSLQHAIIVLSKTSQYRSEKWSSIVQYLCNIIWDLKHTFHNIQQWWYFIFCHILDEDMLLKTKQCTQQLFLTQHSITRMPTTPLQADNNFTTESYFLEMLNHWESVYPSLSHCNACTDREERFASALLTCNVVTMLYLNVVPRLIFISLKKIYLWWCLGL